MRVTTAAFSGMTDSRFTGRVGYKTMARERVVGMFNACMAAESGTMLMKLLQ